MREAEYEMLMGRSASSLAIMINKCINDALALETFEEIEDDMDKLSVILSSLAKVLACILSGIKSVDDDADLYEEYLAILTKVVNSVMAVLEGEGNSVN